MFVDTKGLASFKQLCAPEYSAVELQLRHKYYGLAASYALLKYVEYIKNVLYAPKSLKVEFQVGLCLTNDEVSLDEIVQQNT